MLIQRDLYSVKSWTHPITWVMFRGRVRKYCLWIEQNIVLDNSESWEEEVHFGIPTWENPEKIIKYINSIVPETIISLEMTNIANPVVSKFKVNDESRYTL